MSSVSLVASIEAIVNSIYKNTHKDVSASAVTLGTGDLLLLGFVGLPNGAKFGKINSIEVSLRGNTQANQRSYCFIDGIDRAFDSETVTYSSFSKYGPKSGKSTAQYIYWTGTAWRTHTYDGSSGDTPPGLIQILKYGLVIDKPTGEIYTHLNGTAANRPKLTIDYDDSTLAAPTVEGASPAAGTFCAKGEPTTFSWSLGTSFPVVGEYEQASAVLYWRASSGSTSQSVSIEDGTMSYTLPAGTFTTSAPQWRVVVTCTDGSTCSTSWTTLDTADVTPDAAEILAPKDIAVNGSDAIDLSWIHNISTGTQPMGCDIQKSFDGVTSDITGGTLAAAKIMDYRSVNLFQRSQFGTNGWVTSDNVIYSGQPCSSASQSTFKTLVQFSTPVNAKISISCKIMADPNRSENVKTNNYYFGFYYVTSSNTFTRSAKARTDRDGWQTITYTIPEGQDIVAIKTGVAYAAAIFTWYIQDLQIEINSSCSAYRAAESGGSPDSTDIDVIEMMTDAEREAIGRLPGATMFSAPPGTFPAGNPKWRVRTYNSDYVAGPWSDWANLTSITKPATPNLTVTKVSPRAEITWSVSGQQAYQYQFDDYDSGPLFGTKAEAKSPVFLAMNQSHTARVRVQNKYGIWSDWAEAKFTPTRPGGSPVPSIGVFYPTPDENVELLFIPYPGLTEYWIYRDGVLVERTTETFYTDYYLAGTTAYRIVATNPDTDDYAERTIFVTATFEGTVIADAETGEWIRCRLTPEQVGTTTIRMSRQISQTYYAGHPYPRGEMSEFYSKTLTFQVGFIDGDAVRLEELVGRQVIMKDKETLITGVLTDLTSRHNVMYKTYTITLAQLDRSDEEVVIDD